MCISKLIRHSPSQEPDRALVKAKYHLNIIEIRNSEILEIAKDLRTMREKNNFALQLQSIMEGPKWPNKIP